MLYDIVIKEAAVVDGSGDPAFTSDVAIKNSQIVRMGSVKAKAKTIIDAKGLIICPGFIDIHSHSDFSVVAFRAPESKILQGVTSEVIGNCGISATPLDAHPQSEIDAQFRALTTLHVDKQWRTLDDYIGIVEEQGLLSNLIPLVGHGNLRISVMGLSANKPSVSQQKQMNARLRKMLDDGAFGFSSGLIYPPGCFSTTEELVQLARIAAESGSIYSTHIRGESHTLIKAFHEAVSIAEETGVSLQISHHKAVGKENWGKTKETLGLIESARAQGVDVASDVYPYLAGSGSMSSLLPNWVHEGGREKLLMRLRSIDDMRRLKREIEVTNSDWWNPVRATGWENIIISQARTAKWKAFLGKALGEVAAELGSDPFEVLINLVVDESGNATGIFFQMCEADLVRVLTHPTTMIGSDGYALPLNSEAVLGKPHPRSFGTFPRVLARYVRSQNVLTLEGAVRKMTALPAAKLGLRSRGLVREGFVADLVILDQGQVSDQATFEDPFQSPKSIFHVIVNGVFVVRDGQLVGTAPGRVLLKASQARGEAQPGA
ncbi:MAG TPA: D-aminoacylase [Candidatus Bipolaricaulis anaerobius]|nr:D-aminoacylase [Candidatus Bipolaricaulis anaerobius]HNS23702.1 D-aminoacylase [Candidatus Bipolaricaulis anaerobius]